MLEFDSTFEEPQPKVEICVVYDRRNGRIVSMHQFVGDGTGLFGPEGREERERIARETVKQQHQDVGEGDRVVMHAPPDFRPEPKTVYRVDVASYRIVAHLSEADFAERRDSQRSKT